MALSLQPYQQQQQQKQSSSLRNLYAIDGQISQPVPYFNAANFVDQSPHPPYVPASGSDGGADLQWTYGFEPKKKRLKEQDFFENNSQMSSANFLKSRSVSNWLELSLDYYDRVSPCGDSALLALTGDNGVDQELRRQDAEIDRFLKVQGGQLRQAILEKVQANQFQTISYLEDKVLQKLREKEAEMENINRRNVELEERVEQLSMEACAWQQRANYTESMITALQFNLKQIYARDRDGKEGCGDSEVDDTASCCNGRLADFHLLCKEVSEMKESIFCSTCRVNKVCMLLLPCKHLCLCQDCESRLSFCPLCRSSKLTSMEVYM